MTGNIGIERAKREIKKREREEERKNKKEKEAAINSVNEKFIESMRERVCYRRAIMKNAECFFGSRREVSGKRENKQVKERKKEKKGSENQ